MIFGISDGGTIEVITNRVFHAILNLKESFVYWPAKDERDQLIAATFHELPHCVGYVDGCAIKLAEKPSENEDIQDRFFLIL